MNSNSAAASADSRPGARHRRGTAAPEIAARSRPSAKVERFLLFRRRIGRELLSHRVITANRYAAWFASGTQTKRELQAFVVQFSVFSNLFLLAQLRKMINADSLGAMRASKEILANEIGVAFRHPDGAVRGAGRAGRHGTDGSVQGGTFRFEAAHFEWLLQTAAALGLRFADVGRPRHATPATRHFCDELYRLYGAEDYAVSQAASFAVENWAAAGFWKQLIQGFILYNERTDSRIPLGFFRWHDRIEDQHARHTQEELEDYYFASDVDEDAFIRYGNEMLDGVAAFWDGLEAQRKAAKRKRSVRGLVRSDAAPG